jgi:ribosomal protein S18 acetylase RimI-like enzyme
MSLYKHWAEKDGEIVSWLYMYTVKLPSRFLAVIEEVNTVEAYRRQGLATKILLDAIEFAQELGVDCIELTVREDKPEIQEFYKSLGFFDRLNRAYRLNLGGR